MLKLYVEELNSPNSDNDIQRTYMLQNIEKKQLGLTSSQNKSASSIAQTASIKNVADLFAVIKAKDKQFNPGKEVNIKLFNGDGMYAADAVEKIKDNDAVYDLMTEDGDLRIFAVLLFNYARGAQG